MLTIKWSLQKECPLRWRTGDSGNQSETIEKWKFSGPVVVLRNLSVNKKKRRRVHGVKRGYSNGEV